MEKTEKPPPLPPGTKKEHPDAPSLCLRFPLPPGPEKGRRNGKDMENSGEMAEIPGRVSQSRSAVGDRTGSAAAGETARLLIVADELVGMFMGERE